MKHRTIGVLMGGLSSERAVSLRSGEAVVAALTARGHRAVPIYVDRDLDRVLRQAPIDVAFIALHGRYGEDGCVQGLLEMMGIPYTGSDVLASALAMHKVKAKELFRIHNLPTPPYYVAAGDPERAIGDHGDFGYPCVVKPAREGSSIGVTIVEDQRALAAAIEAAACFDGEVVVERYIAGQEISVAVVGDRPLGAIEIAAPNGHYDFAAKVAGAAVDYFLPPRLSPERYRGVLAQGARAAAALGCRGASRVDLIVSPTGNEYVLEVNTVPAMTPRSLLPMIAAAAGIDFGELCEAQLFAATLPSAPPRGDRRLHQRGFDGDDRRTTAVSPH